MAIEPLRDNLDTVTPTDQPNDGDSSSQQQLTMYNYDLSGPPSTVLSPANQASTYLLGGVTGPGLCSVNSSLGQNQFQIGAGCSPEHRQIRSNDALHYISQMLMEDVDERVDICQGEAAIQAAEQPFRDILGQVYTPALYSNNKQDSPDKSGTSCYKRLWSTSFSNDCSSYILVQPLTTPLSPYICNRSLSQPNQPLISVGWTSGSGFPDLHRQRSAEEENIFAPSIDNVVIYLENGILCITKLTTNAKVGERGENTIFEVADQRGWGILEGRSNKHHAITTCAIIRNENFDRILLYGRKSFDQITRLREMMAETGNNNTLKGRSNGRPKLWARKQQRQEFVDIRALLFQCAQAVAEDNHLFANELLRKIREHSSADGDCTQRLAFYLADGLEARLAGIGGQVYRNLMERRTSTTDWLDAYSLFLASCPFDRTSYYFANQAILDVSQGKPRVHIVDFGISFGFQWPLMIQRFAQREEGAPKLRITGIDTPQQSLRPCEMIEETGKRLADYANMFKVPFQYQGIAASRWETIKIEDLNIAEDEVLIINCIFRMKNLGHETEAINGARNELLKTMRRMNPKVFISGNVNGFHSSPFFIQRFKEVMLHYSSMFDILDANVPRDNEAR
ncbi:scarecrow-like protein 9 [Triticum urartu]|uniref:scarecrow-like protein 9 n=1 Tax=Triticum urartu TaxID=4572 RepID=UPI002044356B|nr:scarecrow-like protein 9 [Triticum urartu]